MVKQYSFNFLDLLVLIVKHKAMIFIICLITAITSYLFLRFYVDEKFDASALIIPAEDQTLGGLGGMLKGLKDLPIGIGGIPSNESIGMYNTIISSRTTLQEIINEFNLVSVYDIDSTEQDYLERTMKRLGESISTTETSDEAYIIKVRDKSPIRATDITNYMVNLLNRRIIELKTQKSKNNRVFLEERLVGIKNNLKNAEDSLKLFQEKSGLLDVENQLRGILDVYSSLEATLITKQVQMSIYEKIYDINSPIVTRAKTELNEYEKKLNEIKSKGLPQSILLSKSSIPKNTIEYLRHYRDVEINSAILEFVLPLYEQARIEEQRNIPVLQIVDYAVVPQKRSYPPRLLYTAMITFFVFFSTCFYLFISSLINNSENAKIKFIFSSLSVRKKDN